MKSLRNHQEHNSELLKYRILFCTILLFCCSFIQSFSQSNVSIPVAKDSLDRLGFIKFGIGRGSFNVTDLNLSLRKSKLNEIKDIGTAVNLECVLMMGKGLVLDYGFNYNFGQSSVTNDKDGVFTTKIASFGLELNLGYAIIDKPSFILIPSVGINMGDYTTEIALVHNGPIPLLEQNNPESSIRERLVNRPDASISEISFGIGSTCKLSAYFKLKSYKVEEEEIAFRGPRENIKIQTRDEIWLGTYISYYSQAGFSSSQFTNMFDLMNKRDGIGYGGGGINFGLQFVWAMSMRELKP